MPGIILSQHAEGGISQTGDNIAGASAADLNQIQQDGLIFGRDAEIRAGPAVPAEFAGRNAGAASRRIF